MATKIINVLKDDKFQDILDIFKKTSSQEVIFVLPKKHKALAKEDDFEALSTVAEEQGKNILILTSNPEVNNLALQYSFGVLANEKPPTEGRLKKAKKKAPEPEPKPEPESEPEPEPEPKQKEAVEEEPVEKEEPVEEEPKTVDVASYDDSGAEDEDEDEDSDEKTGNNDDNDAITEDSDDDQNDRWNDDGGAPASARQQDQDLPDIELAAVKKPTRIISDVIEPAKEGERVRVGISRKPERPLEVNVRQDTPKTDLSEIESVWQRPSSSPNPARIKNEKIAALPRSSFVLPRFSLLNISRTALYSLGVGVVVMFAVVLYLVTGSAQISVKLKAYPVVSSLKVSASADFTSVDQELKRIPGQLFSVSKNIEETFPATGEKDVVQKARGKITVYNEYGTTPQVLIATTRFESESGLIFRTLQTVTVPGTKVQNGKITPGSIQVDIIADKAGDTYNVAAGKFTIPAFKEKGDADRYQKFYGKSEEAIKGGIVGKAKVITEQDYINARKKMEERIISETEQELKSQAGGLKILSLSQPVVKDITSTGQIDEAADNFTLSTKAELSTVGFKDADLNSLIADYVGKVNDLMILPEKIKIEFKDVNFNSEEKILGFTVSFLGSAYKQVEKDKIISDLIGKNEEQIKDYMKAIDGIVSAKVILSPFWVRKVPANKEKIKYEIQYE